MYTDKIQKLKARMTHPLPQYKQAQINTTQVLSTLPPPKKPKN